MTARVHRGGWPLKVRRRRPVRAGSGWPGFDEVHEIRYGGRNEHDDAPLLLEVVGDEAALDLAHKLIAAVEEARKK